jgi:hypothetical protein
MSCAFAFLNLKDLMGKLCPRSDLEGLPNVIKYPTQLIEDLKSEKAGKPNVKEEENYLGSYSNEVKKEEE